MPEQKSSCSSLTDSCLKCGNWLMTRSGCRVEPLWARTRYQTPAHGLGRWSGLGLGIRLSSCWPLGSQVPLPFQGAAYLRAINELVKTVSKYRKEKTRVPDKIKGKQANLGAALEARKRNGRGG